jgi:hypothetical protein
MTAGQTLQSPLYDIAQHEMSHSKLASWNRCRYQYHLQYEREIVPRLDRPAIRIGSAVHAGLAQALASFRPGTAALQQDYSAHLSATPEENGFQGVVAWCKAVKDAVPDLTEEEKAALIETELLACGIVQRTVKELDLFHKWETVRLEGWPLVEHQLYSDFLDKRGRRHRIGPFKTFRATVDWIARELDTGAIWLVDHKCYSTFQPVEHEEFNVQMAIYQALLIKHKIETCGSICHQIRPELPKEPKRNKDGSMSRADCLTDWPTYEAALRRAGLNPEHYSEMEEKLGAREWWRMSRAFRTVREALGVYHRIALPGIREVARRGKSIHRTMGVMTCNGCQVRDFCLEDLRGGDTDFLLKTKYRLRSEPAEYKLPVLEDDE